MENKLEHMDGFYRMYNYKREQWLLSSQNKEMHPFFRINPPNLNLIRMPANQLQPYKYIWVFPKVEQKVFMSPCLR